MKRLKKLTYRQKREVSQRVGNIEGWKYEGIGEREDKNITYRTHEYVKVKDGEIVDRIYEVIKAV
ncbi:hypothetical protein QJR26_03370 [Clostridium baratii]